MDISAATLYFGATAEAELFSAGCPAVPCSDPCGPRALSGVTYGTLPSAAKQNRIDSA
jgi:hypothetical protein